MGRVRLDSLDSPGLCLGGLTASLRVYLTSYTNMCFIIGQLIAAGVLEGLVHLSSEWSYRMPFALQWFWPAFLFPVLLFAPKSPWHLVPKGRLEEAAKSLARLQSKSANINPQQTLATIASNFVGQKSPASHSQDKPRGWALPAEVGSTCLRQNPVCLARNAYYIIGVVAGVLEPYFFNPTQWNLKGYTAFVWGGTALLTFIWAYFRLPETRGRSYEELDMLLAKNIQARKFSMYQVDAYDEQQTAQLSANHPVMMTVTTGEKEMADHVEHI
ncbi:hypothetical protein V1522DRAFT_441480 [Lipomyces starkeyi]